MSDLRKAAEMALDALEAMMAEFKALDLPYGSKAYALAKDARLDLRAALAELEQEPVAYIHRHGNHWEVTERYLCDDEKARGWTEEPLYTHPPQRKPLTDEEIQELSQQHKFDSRMMKFVRIIERAHGIGGEYER